MDCDGKDENCPFFKTMEKHLADREAANKRIATLPDWQQTAISEKHYGGEKPWAKPNIESIITEINGNV
jgi:cell fate (sporulation/competence/biofilm development) regulator YmcA (YheA/YmcA/DUF963 family)